MIEFRVTELIGIIATLFIVVAFSLNGELKIRIFDLIGAVIFIIYGFLIYSFSTVLLNTILVGIQIYKIIKLKKEENIKNNQKESILHEC